MEILRGRREAHRQRALCAVGGRHRRGRCTEGAGGAGARRPAARQPDPGRGAFPDPARSAPSADAVLSDGRRSGRGGRGRSDAGLPRFRRGASRRDRTADRNAGDEYQRGGAQRAAASGLPRHRATGGSAAVADRDRTERRAQSHLGPLWRALQPGRRRGGGECRCAAGHRLRTARRGRAAGRARATHRGSHRVGAQPGRSVERGRPRLAAGADLARPGVAPGAAGSGDRPVPRGDAADPGRRCAGAVAGRAGAGAARRDGGRHSHDCGLPVHPRHARGAGQHAGDRGPAPPGLAALLRV